MRVGIVGYGVTGMATASVFPEVLIYDPQKGYPDPQPLGTCDVVFVCLPTPTRDGRQDVSILRQGLEAIAPCLRDEQVVVLRSTVLPGTTRHLQQAYRRLALAHNPEFLRSHRALEDMRDPYRIVIGAEQPHTRRLLADAYRGSLITDVDRRLILTDTLTAEVVKYAANCYLAMKVSYFNVLYDICRDLGADYEALRTALGMDPRIGSGDESIINPQDRGFDDECLPKDLDAFITYLLDQGFPATLFQSTAEVNAELRSGPEREEVEL